MTISMTTGEHFQSGSKPPAVIPWINRKVISQSSRVRTTWYYNISWVHFELPNFADSSNSLQAWLGNVDSTASGTGAAESLSSQMQTCDNSLSWFSAMLLVRSFLCSFILPAFQCVFKIQLCRFAFWFMYFSSNIFGAFVEVKRSDTCKDAFRKL